MRPDAITDVFSLIRYFEGLALKPVPDSKGRVLGWGRNIDVQGWYDSENVYLAQKYGHDALDREVHILTNGIDEADADLMLRNDVQDRIGKLLAHDWFANLNHKSKIKGETDTAAPVYRVCYPECIVRVAVVIAMAYQMGTGIFDLKSPARWPDMICALKAGHWTLVAIHGLNSEWGRTQTPERAWVECAMLQSGVWPTIEELKPR